MLPDLATFTLSNGPAECLVADPRTNPLLLGSRYVHGGYVLRLSNGKELISGFPNHEWNPFFGCGLPEVFETGLGFDACKPGDTYMRIGSGRVRRSNDTTWNQSDMVLEQAVEWSVDDKQATSLTMSCHDSMEISGNIFGYELVRQLTLEENRLTSRTGLKLTVPWSEPVIWFAHPFFAQKAGDGVGLKASPSLKPSNGELLMDNAGYYRFGKNGGFSTIFGAWGSTSPVELVADEDRQIRLNLSRPLDKLVCFATPTAFSVEPYISRGWLDGEFADWKLSYQWTAAKP